MILLLSDVTKMLATLKKEVEQFSSDENTTNLSVLGEKNKVVFISIGMKNARAKVLKSAAKSYKRAFENVEKNVLDVVRKNNLAVQWLKVDIVTEVEKITMEELHVKVLQTKRNFFRTGISFDQEFKIAFLEQEVLGNVFIVDKPFLRLSEQMIQNYLTINGSSTIFSLHLQRNKPVYLFGTKSWIQENEVTHELMQGPFFNGVRKAESITDEVHDLIGKSTYFLANEITESGKFIYGYFPTFAKEIDFYNNLRHASSIYSLLEGYEYLRDDTLLEPIKRAIDYLVREMVVYRDGFEQKTAYIVEHDGKEIKLGAMGVSVIMLSKYMKLTNSTEYIEVARAIARGIQTMIQEDGKPLHVLEYPTYELLDEFRIIYYNGEAAFGLVRLYEIDQDESWMNTVKLLFDYFIENDLYKEGDHWLSYASNEITEYFPEDKYFEFGLKNSFAKLDYMYHRLTTFPTFLELMMAAYKMIKKINSLEKQYLLEKYDIQQLYKTIDRRLEYQRVGFFYPEIAMYMKNPEQVLNGFFIRHHAFRVRIDDIEHYLSSYVQYMLYRAPDLAEGELQPILDNDFR